MRLTTTTALLLMLAAPALSAQTTAAAHSPSPPDIKWGPAPAIFPAGAQMAVMHGDPSGTGLFTVRLRFPDGYKLPSHTHPTDEHVTVVSGTLHVGMGAKFETKGMMALGAGGYVVAPANHAHYVRAQGETVVQVHAMGPFALTYVNAADTPRAGASR